MAETLTMESNVEKTSIDSLSAEEQDSLQVGEQMQEAQDNLLAGKYKSAQELEQGYLELQKKLGQQTEEAPETTEEQPEEEQGEPTILDRIWEESTSREEFTPELTEEISKLSSTELANMYLDYRQNVEETAPQTRDFTEQEVGELKGIVGGDQQYTQMLDWAQSNLNKQEIDMFDQVMQTGDPLAAFFAVRSLGYAYQNAIGYDGNMIQGKAPKQNTDQFRSQQEVIAAMGDPRYENDPAYRRDIMDKLERSPNVNF
tara:strand:+ start:205 stop:978 length:774 start_codon:yes stop_codon:yes gene_type:complete